MKTKNHIWNFVRIGGVNRVSLNSGSDLQHLSELDQKLWTALSCPVNGLEIEPKTLQLIDTDEDGKIRVPEILKAVSWTLSLIKDPDHLLLRSQSMPLSVINDASEEGKLLKASARQILRNLGKEGQEELSVAETSDVHTIFANTKFNGDGVITEASADDENDKALIRAVMATVGNVPDLSGADGVNMEMLARFGEECTALHDRYRYAEENMAEVSPFGDRTDEAFALFSRLKPKIDDYFLRCRLAVFDPESAEMLNKLSDRIQLINHRNLSECITEIESYPLAKIQAGNKLKWGEAINPAWAQLVLEFRNLVAGGHKSLAKEINEDDWSEISRKFAAYDQWKVRTEGALAEPLGIDWVRDYLASDGSERLISLIEKDKTFEGETQNIFLVDKLVRYYSNLFTLLNNFITFSDFYAPERKSIFQAGTLFFDQRSCDLCIRVSDMGKHNQLAGKSGICLVYCECVSKKKGDRMTIVAAFTDGDVDNLEVGRNALFYDNQGDDWDATIVKVIENPISIRQAFWTPYRKMSKLISKQIEKFASSQDEKVNTSASTGIEKAGDQTIQKAVQGPGGSEAQGKPAPFDIAKFAGIFAAIGLAFAAIGAVLTQILTGFLNLTWWKMPLVLLGVLLLISGPSMILAWLKLRKRNLAMVLDANGWAINARTTINIAFGATLTNLAKLPGGAKLDPRDPFRKKRSPLYTLLIVLIIAVVLYLLWNFGVFQSASSSGNGVIE